MLKILGCGVSGPPLQGGGGAPCIFMSGIPVGYVSKSWFVRVPCPSCIEAGSTTKILYDRSLCQTY